MQIVLAMQKRFEGCMLIENGEEILGEIYMVYYNIFA